MLLKIIMMPYSVRQILRVVGKRGISISKFESIKNDFEKKENESNESQKQILEIVQ